MKTKAAKKAVAGNELVWRPRRPGHLEAWELHVSQRSSNTGFWIRHSIAAPLSGGGSPTCSNWFAFYDTDMPRSNVAFNEGFAIDALQRDGDRLAFENKATLAPSEMTGTIGNDGRGVRWDLSFSPAPFVHRYLPELASKLGLGKMQLLAVNPLIHVDGRITVGDSVYELDSDPACQIHRWGSAHHHAWALASCGAFREDTTASLQLASVRTSLGPIASPPLTFLSLYFGSEVYEFAELPASLACRANWSTGLLQFSATGKRVKLEGELRARPEDLVRAELHDPDGESVYSHTTEVADAVVTVWTRRSRFGRFRQLCRLTSRSAHFEYGSRTPDLAVARRVEPVNLRSPFVAG